MAAAAANERKVFILHDDGENATAARLRTGVFSLLTLLVGLVLTDNSTLCRQWLWRGCSIPLRL